MNTVHSPAPQPSNGQATDTTSQSQLGEVKVLIVGPASTTLKAISALFAGPGRLTCEVFSIDEARQALIQTSFDVIALLAEDREQGLKQARQIRATNSQAHLIYFRPDLEIEEVMTLMRLKTFDAHSFPLDFDFLELRLNQLFQQTGKGTLSTVPQSIAIARSMMKSGGTVSIPGSIGTAEGNGTANAHSMDQLQSLRSQMESLLERIEMTRTKAAEVKDSKKSWDEEREQMLKEFFSKAETAGEYPLALKKKLQLMPSEPGAFEADHLIWDPQYRKDNCSKRSHDLKHALGSA
ncbi:MAG: hypothetical protein JJU20_02265 [Opitutales bacterium]|nr:hypothetical protein [Opitutales bacterium]